MSDIETIEISIEQAKAVIETANALDRLHENKDFQAIFLEGYMKSHVLRNVGLKASFGAQDEKTQKYIDAQIMGVGSLQQYIAGVYQKANAAVTSIVADEEEMETLLEEEV